MAYQLRTRPPTGRVTWPLILLEGGEKAGKSWAAAEFSADPRIGRTFWIDLGEGAGDEYGAIPGARYEIVEHDGTWQSIIGAVEQIHAMAKQVRPGEPPMAIVIDSMTLVWEMLKDWVGNRAKETKANKRLLAEDPNAEISVTSNFWVDANARHRRLMTLLMTFPGVAVITARGKEVSAMTNGQPDARKPKEYRVEGQKDIGHDATVWVRLSRDSDPQIIAYRSVYGRIRPGKERPQRVVDDFSVAWVVFDFLRCEPGQAHVRDLVELRPGSDAPPTEQYLVLSEAIPDAPTLAALKSWYDRIEPALEAGDITRPEAAQLSCAVKARKAELEVEQEGQAA